MTKRHPDEVTPQFWTPESLHAYLLMWRGEPHANPGWWVCWDYDEWRLIFVQYGAPDWWVNLPAYRKLCILGQVGDPMPDVKYLMDEPLEWHEWAGMEPLYHQLEMNL